MTMIHPTLFLAWQDPKSRAWFPIGRLRWRPAPLGLFDFRYTRGFHLARAAGLEPLVGFSDVERTYEAPELFPQFRNRVMSTSRADFGAYLERLDLVAGDRALEMEILVRSGGRRTTDKFEVFGLPLRATPEGALRYDLTFFVHGMRYVPHAEERAMRLVRHSVLRLMDDWQNPHHGSAVALRTDEDASLLGWLPRYYCDDIAYLRGIGVQPNVVVERVNPSPAPVQHLLLARLLAPWPTSERPPLAGDEYLPIAEAG